MNRVAAVHEVTAGQVVAIDGKTVWRSYDRAARKSAIYKVSAWGSANGLVLGQLKTEEKSNEITTIPQLLELLEIKGCNRCLGRNGLSEGDSGEHRESRRRLRAGAEGQSRTPP